MLDSRSSPSKRRKGRTGSRKGNPTNREFARRFDAAAGDYDRITADYSFRRRLEILRAAEGLVLDIGAGTGRIAASLDRARAVVCADISFGMSLQAREKRGLRAVCCDAEALPFRPQSFDAVLSSESIFYLRHPRRLIDDAARALKPSGLFLITLFNREAAVYWHVRRLLSRIPLFRRAYFDDGAREFLPLPRLIRDLKQAGFRIEEIRRTVILPWGGLDGLNRLLEKTPFSRWAWFVMIKARLLRRGPEKPG